MNAPRISFLAFFLLWAERMGWEVPTLHVRVCTWLQRCGQLAVLMLPRGHAKSTILAVYNAWRYYVDPQHRVLHQSESDGTAYKTSRDTQNVLRHHPLTRGMLPEGIGTVEQWWVTGAAEVDARNASMYAKGILSNVTSSRADECQNDDIEVPRNIATAEARAKLRYRLGEQTHILVPGGRKLYVGTPHAHDSIYQETIALGADSMIVRMFELEHRIEKSDKTRYLVPFIPEYVFSGIGSGARLLQPVNDYRMEGLTLVLAHHGGDLLDCYACAAWPERFDREELEKRRRQTRTLNEWDSQYQLHAKPVTQVRLDPTRIIPYDVAPVFREANGEAGMFLGAQRIAGASARWDPSSGKLRSDVSAVAVVLQDDGGRRYVHRVLALRGDIAEFGGDGKTITGGQVWQLCDVIQELQLPRLVVENNGIGQFAPAILRGCLKQRKLVCSVIDEPSVGNKNRRILETMEPLLLSHGRLWAHVDVLRGPLWQQMRDWNPGTQDQADDYLDASSGAIGDTPERIQPQIDKRARAQPADWRTGSGVYEATFER